MEGRLPCERPVGLQFHAEEGVRERGEVVVVDARVEVGCLCRERGEGLDVLRDGFLGAP